MVQQQVASRDLVEDRVVPVQVAQARVDDRTMCRVAEVVPPGLKWGILAVSVLIPIVGVGMGLYYWIKGGSEEKAAVGRLWFFVALGLAIFYSLIVGEGY